MLTLPDEATKASTSPINDGIKGYSCTLYKDYLVFYGGIYDGKVVNRFFVWSLKDERIKQKEKNDRTPWRRFGHSASCKESENKIFFFGGKRRVEKFGYRGFDQYENLAEEVCATMEIEREDDGLIRSVIDEEYGEGPVCLSPVSIWQDDKVYAYQANHENGNFGELYSCEMKEKTKKWQKLDASAGNMKLHWPSGITIWIQNKLYLFTENVDHRPTRRPGYCEYIDDVYVLDVNKIRPGEDKKGPEWERISSSGEVPGILSNISMTEANGVIYIFGSSHHGKEEPKSVLWVYDTNEKKWKKVQEIETLTARINQKAVIYKGQLLIIDWHYDTQTVGIQYKNLGNITFASPLPNSKGRDLYKDKYENFIQDAKNFYEGKLFFDITFEVEGEEISAHKALLADQSDYFMKMFTSGMSESHSAKVSLPNMKSHIFKAILQYIYCKEVELDEQLALDLIPFIDEYLIKGLKGICEKYLCKKLRKENVIDLLIIADKHEVTELKKACFRLILKNLNNVDEKEELKKLPNSLLVELLRLKTPDSQQKSKI